MRRRTPLASSDAIMTWNAREREHVVNLVIAKVLINVKLRLMRSAWLMRKMVLRGDSVALIVLGVRGIESAQHMGGVREKTTVKHPSILKLLISVRSLKLLVVNVIQILTVQVKDLVLLKVMEFPCA